MSEIAIKVEGLSKEYSIGLNRSGSFRESFARRFKHLMGEKVDGESFMALNDISFDIKKGEAVGIIGRNGAGKSTLLKILSRITEPTKGRIEINGRVSSLLEVGTGFHPELTGRENIYLNGTILGMTRREVKSKFDEIVEFSGVEKFIDTPVKHYSSGMKVRLAFSVAAHLDPEILIIDEVLAVGDAEFQKKCLGKMEDVTGQGRTVLFVSHNMGAVENLCKRIIYLDSGKIKSIGNNPKRTIDQYLFGINTDKTAIISEWENEEYPMKNEIHTITRFAVTITGNKRITTPVSYNSSLEIHVEGEILQPHPKLNIGYAVYDEMGRITFWSYCKDHNNSDRLFDSIGSFKIKSLIPNNYLSSKKHRIELISGLTNIKWLYEPGSGPSLKLEVHGGFQNVQITPELIWEKNDG